MDIPWFILLILLLSPLVSNYKFHISDELAKNCTNQSENVFIIELWENNRVPDANHVLLFTISEVPSAPIWQITPTPFQYKQVSDDDDSYSFYTNQFMDYETETTHSYLLTSTLDNELIFITINTINYDDEEPTLTAPMCTMKENTPYTAENTTCNATLSDPDGWLSQTTFTILNSKYSASNDLELEDHLFEIYFEKNISDTVFRTTVFIVTKQTLDYETKTFYSFPIQARDSANHTTIPNTNVTCIIDVDDLNDMPPQWTDYFSTKQIQEETQYTFNVTAVDGDRKINAPINYSLISHDPDVCAGGPCITIATVDGVGIILVEPIDRDEKDLSNYKFDIMAQEQDDPPFFITLNITFYVDDIDDNNPLFINITGSNYTMNLMNQTTDIKVIEYVIWENFAGTLDGSVFIQDIDTGENAQFNVKLQEDPERDYADVLYTEAFIVVPTAGYRHGDFQISVKNYSYLDFENVPWQNISFFVHSSGTKNSSKTDDLLVKVNLKDYNDEFPKFSNSAYTAEVNETIKLGQEIITVKATDRDKEDIILRHQLIGAPSIVGLMTIDSGDGNITVAVNDAFDYDKINPVIFQVQAIDAVNHSTTISVTVNLLDVNNKAPTYTVNDVIRVDENQNVGAVLNASILAFDVDTTRKLTAEINWEASYAWKNSIRLNTDTDHLRRAMRFLDIMYNTVPNRTDGTIEIKFVVNNNNEDGTAPDYETFDTLYLHVNITDLNTELPEFQDQMSIDAVIVVNINDVNDNLPIFTNETLLQNRTIYERSRNGSIVGSIKATDADVGDIVSYMCTYVNQTQDWFDCDRNGQITVKSEAIDADTDYVYNVSISCNATDGYWNTSQIFEIYILDTNDKFPQVMVNGTIPSKQVVEVDEKSPAETLVTELKYSDEDRDVPFHTAECRRNGTDTCFDSFKIENNLVKVLRGGNDIDRDEKFPNYTCTITCYDNPRSEQGYGSLDNSTTFIIKLRDINDHAPELKTYHLKVTENLKKGDPVGAVIAEDKDEGLNAEIDMEIVAVTKHIDYGDEDFTNRSLFEIFRIESEYRINSTFKQWKLTANNDLRDQYGNYTVQLKLSDQGVPQNSTDQAFLKVTLNKYNYYPPVFLFPNSSKTSFLLTSDQNVEHGLVMYYLNETFGDIRISDGNGTNTCLEKWTPAFNLELLDDKLTQFFALSHNESNKCAAQLQVTDAYNKKEAIDSTYKLRLLVSLDDVLKVDENEADYSEHMDIVINFIDVDESPVFDQSLGPFNISLFEDDSNQYEDLPDERKAYYPKLVDSDEIKKFYFLNTNDKNISETFSVDEDSGTIRLKKKLDYLKQHHYEFEIRASKNYSSSTSQDNSSMQVITNVIEINNHYPQWTQPSFFGALLRSTQKGSTIIKLNATDLDTIDEGKLKYTLNSTINGTGSESISRIEQAFTLDEESGAVNLNFQVEYNMNGYFIFFVKVEDAPDGYGNGPHENITTVTIHIVTEDNTVTFKFENNLDTTVNKKSQILEIISNRLGWDCHEQSIDNNSENGVLFDNVTAASIYCIQNHTLLPADDIKSKLNNINTFQQLKNELLEQGILLQSFNSASTTTGNDLETTLKAALIGVTVVLGAMCIILAVTFFLKARELSRRLSRLTEKKFGSDESNLNRKGINAPTTNVFAVEGSNPVFNIESSKRDDFIKQTDSISMDSGNSDIIGVEDDPEFDEMFGKEKFQ